MSIFNSGPKLSSEEKKFNESFVKRINRGWTFIGVGLFFTIVLMFLPVPFVIQQPGPVYNTLGDTLPLGRNVSSHDEAVDLIHISGHETYPTSGTLSLVTVSLVGNLEQRPSWLQAIQAWFNPSKAVVPIDFVFPAGSTTQEITQRNARLMVNSQQDSIAAALNHLSIEVVQRVEVVEIVESGPADGVLQEGDFITAVNGIAVDGLSGLRKAVAENTDKKPAQITFLRDEQEHVVEITPVASANGPILGIGISMVYSFPFEVSIELDNVGGPSAGQMFTLGIIDKLTAQSLTGGKYVAGTGTIDNEGNIAAIGGIQQKMYAAKHDGESQYFLAPAQNCQEAAQNIPDGLDVFSVETLDDSLAILEAIRTGQDLENMPRC